MSQKVTVVMYHYVRELHFTRYPGIRGLLTSQFKKQLAYLNQHYTFVTIEDCLNNLYEDEDLPSNACLLTFDDAYIDHFLTVFPILESNRIQGSFFPPAKVVLENKVLDVNKIHFIIASAYKCINKLISDVNACLNKYRSKFQLNSNSYYYSKLAIKNRFDSSEIVYIKSLLQMELEEKVRKLIINELFKKYVTNDEESFSRELYMDLDQMKCMLRNGMYIGGHGYQHDWLDKLPVEKQKVEINETLTFLKKIGAQTKDWAMAYPYGVYNDSLIEILKKNDCALAFTTKVDIANLSKENAFTLERLDTNDFPKTENGKINHWTEKIN